MYNKLNITPSFSKDIVKHCAYQGTLISQQQIHTSNINQVITFYMFTGPSQLATAKHYRGKTNSIWLNMARNQEQLEITQLKNVILSSSNANPGQSNEYVTLLSNLNAQLDDCIEMDQRAANYNVDASNEVFECDEGGGDDKKEENAEDITAAAIQEANEDNKEKNQDQGLTQDQGQDDAGDDGNDGSDLDDKNNSDSNDEDDLDDDIEGKEDKEALLGLEEAIAATATGTNASTIVRSGNKRKNNVVVPPQQIKKIKSNTNSATIVTTESTTTTTNVDGSNSTINTNNSNPNSNSSNATNGVVTQIAVMQDEDQNLDYLRMNIKKRTHGETQSNHRTTKTQISSSFMIRPGEFYSMYQEGQEIKDIRQNIGMEALQNNQIRNEQKGFYEKTQTSVIDNILNQSILHIRFKFYKNNITIPIYILYVALNVVDINQILHWIIVSEPDENIRKVIVDTIKPYLLFNMGIKSPEQALEYIGSILMIPQIYKKVDLIEAGKFFIRQRLYPHLIYGDTNLESLSHPDGQPMTVEEKLHYKYEWLASYKRGLLGRHILAFMKRVLGIEKPDAIRAFHTLRLVTPGETAEYNMQQAIMQLKKELKRKMKKIDHLDYFMYNPNGPSNLICSEKDTKRLNEMKLANAATNVQESLTLNQNINTTQSMDSNLPFTLGLGPNPHSNYTSSLNSWNTNNTGLNITLNLITNPNPNNNTNPVNYNRYSMADILNISGGISNFVSKMIRKFATPQMIRNNQYDNAGPLYRMFYAFNDVIALSQLNEIVSKNSQFALKEEKEDKPEERGYIDSYETALNDGGGVSKHLSMGTLIRESPTPDDNKTVLYILLNLKHYITIDHNNHNQGITHYDIFNTDPLHSPQDLDYKWYTVMDKISPVGRTKHPNIIVECLRILKGHPEVSPRIHLMSVFIDPEQKHVVYRLDSGACVHPKFRIQSNGKIRLPKCLVKIWARSPTSRIPFLTSHSNTIKYDEFGYKVDHSGGSHANGANGANGTPAHDISLPFHIWFRQLLQFQTIEYIDVLQAQYESIGQTTRQIYNQYKDQKQHSEKYTQGPSANPFYKYTYCDILQALMLSPASQLVGLIQHGSATRLILGSKKNKQAEAQIHYACAVLGGMHDYSKPSMYIIYQQRGQTPELLCMWFRRYPSGAVVLTAMHTLEGFDQDDAIAMVENSGVNLAARRKTYHTEYPFHVGWSSVKKYHESLQQDALISVQTSKDTTKRDYTKKFALYKEKILEDLNQLNMYGTHFILDPKENTVPVFITKNLLKKYNNGSSTKYINHQNMIIENQLKDDIYIDPKYSMVRPGQTVYKGHSLFTSYIIKPIDILNAEVQTIFNKLTNYNAGKYTDTSFNSLQKEMENFKVNRILNKQLYKIKVEEDHNRGIVEEIHNIKCNNPGPYEQYLALFVVSILTEKLGRKWVNRVLDKGVISYILKYYNAIFTLYGVVPTINSNPSGERKINIKKCFNAT